MSRAVPRRAGASVCLENPSTRVSESYFITFGSLGSAADLDQQVVPDPDAPVGSGQAPWRILLGFVSWNGTRFVSVRTEDGGITRRYVGVRAGEVIGLGDSLVLRSAARTVPDKAALVVDNTDGGQMRFGLHDSLRQCRARVHREFERRRDRRGQDPRRHRRRRADRVGRHHRRPRRAAAGGDHAGQVDSGEASLQIQVQPRFQQPASLPPLAAGDYWLHAAARLPRDRPARRVPGALGIDLRRAPPPLVLPGVCDYVVMGFVKRGGRLMDKMNVVTFKSTSHVLGAVMRSRAGRQAHHRGPTWPRTASWCATVPTRDCTRSSTRRSSRWPWSTTTRASSTGRNCSS